MNLRLVLGIVTVAVGMVFYVTQQEPPPLAVTPPAPALPATTVAPDKADSPSVRKTQASTHHPVPPETLNEEIQLTGIMENVNNPALSYAIIENSFTEGRPIKVGNTIKPGILLTEIHSDHIYVKKNNRQYRVDIVNSASDSLSGYAHSAGQSAPGSTSPAFSTNAPPVASRRVSTPMAASYSPRATESRSSFTSGQQVRSANSNLSAEKTLASIVAGAANYQPATRTEYAPTPRSTAAKQVPSSNSVSSAKKEVGMPDFMHVAGSDAYVPTFMREGEQDVLWNQVPDYMKSNNTTDF